MVLLNIVTTEPIWLNLVWRYIEALDFLTSQTKPRAATSNIINAKVCMFAVQSRGNARTELEDSLQL